MSQRPPRGDLPHGGLPPEDDPAVLLDPASDPGGAALGASGAEASVAPPWYQLLHRRVQHRATHSEHHQWWVLGSLLAGLLSLNITFTVFVVALPTVARQLHTNISVLTWTSTGPLLAFGLAAPVLGRVGDLFGHRRLYLWGLVGAILCAVMTATAPTAGVLLVARMLDGIEGAATGTASMALILRVFSPEDRVKAMGWWSLVGAGGPVIGVTVGAPVIQFLGWRALFWGQLGLLIVATSVVLLVLPAGRRRRPVPRTSRRPAEGGAGEGERPSWRSIDWIGSSTLSLGITAALLGLNLAPLLGWTSAGVLAAFTAAGALLVGFAWRELTAREPLIPPHYFRRRNVTMPMGVRAASSFAYFGGFFLFPLLMEQVYGTKVAQVGLISIARPLTFSLSAPAAGYLAVKIGERSSAVLGSISLVASMAIFATLTPQLSLPIVIVALCLSGLGMGVASPSTSSTMANEAAVNELGVMSAAQQLAMQVGEVAGIQVLQTIQEGSARSRGLSSLHHQAALLPTFRHAFWAGAGVAVVGLVASFGIRARRRLRGALPSAPQVRT